MIMRCVSAFAFGNPPIVHTVGSLVSDTDPILKSHGSLFEPVDRDVTRRENRPTAFVAEPMETASAPVAETVEDATAAPGAVRKTNIRATPEGTK
jgi:hypothetical protein